MTDLIDDPAPGQNAPEYTVSEVSGAVKRTLEGAFGRVRVRGEIGRVVRARSGHLYYDLKDDSNVLACTTWKGQASRLNVLPEEGLEVVVTGKMTSFGGQSKYNLNVDDISVAGEGALMAMLERRKKALAAEGLFAAERKKPIPYLPQVIGVVTSPSGAVIRDILHRLRDRFPRKVLVWPVAVQGERCAAEVANAIAGFNRLAPGGAVPRPDLIVVARGGGSLEDLWGFNEEVVVRAAAASDIPLISAVGHETDTTLIDFASDMRAPTPTAAAEMAVPVRAELSAAVAALEARQRQAIARTVELRGQRLRDLSRALPRPEAILAEKSQRLDALGDRLPRALLSLAQSRRVRLGQGAAARFGPQILQHGVERRKDQVLGLAGRLPRGLSGAVSGAKSELRGRGAGLTPALLVRRVSDGQVRLNGLSRILNGLSYEKTLRRGFAVLRGPDGAVISNAKAAKAAGIMEAQFAQDERITLHADSARPPAKPRKPRADEGGQGSLF